MSDQRNVKSGKSETKRNERTSFAYFWYAKALEFQFRFLYCIIEFRQGPCWISRVAAPVEGILK